MRNIISDIEELKFKTESIEEQINKKCLQCKHEKRIERIENFLEKQLDFFIIRNLN